MHSDINGSLMVKYSNLPKLFLYNFDTRLSLHKLIILEFHYIIILQYQERNFAYRPEEENRIRRNSPKITEDMEISSINRLYFI
jgi:hypothetical protein